MGVAFHKTVAAVQEIKRAYPEHAAGVQKKADDRKKLFEKSGIFYLSQALAPDAKLLQNVTPEVARRAQEELAAYIHKQFPKWEGTGLIKVSMTETELIAECQVELNRHLLKDDDKLVVAAQTRPRVRDYFEAVASDLPYLTKVGNILMNLSASEGCSERVFCWEGYAHGYPPTSTPAPPNHLSDIGAHIVRNVTL